MYQVPNYLFLSLNHINGFPARFHLNTDLFSSHWVLHEGPVSDALSHGISGLAALYFPAIPCTADTVYEVHSELPSSPAWCHYQAL